MIEAHLVGGNEAISVQVLREFYAAPRRLRCPLSEGQNLAMVEYFSTFKTLSEDVGLVLGAARRAGELSILFWDAMIVEAALKPDADRLFTENLQHGQIIIEGMRVENPFS